MSLKPIHKFNGGIGATLCHKCSVIIHRGFTDDLYCEEHGGKPEFAYKIVRKSDNLVNYGNKIQWIEWDENDRFKEAHHDIGVGRSLVLDFAFGSFTWMTSRVNSFTKEGDELIFNTMNSTYTLYELSNKD